MSEKSEYQLFVEWLVNDAYKDVLYFSDFNLGYGKPNISRLREVLSKEELERLAFNFNQNVYENNANTSDEKLKKMLLRI